MSDCSILYSPRRHLLPVVICPEDPERADPHQRAVGLAAPVLPARQRAEHGSSAVKGLGIQPNEIALPSLLRGVISLLREQPGED